MILNDEYGDVSVKYHDPNNAGALIAWDNDLFAVDQRVKIWEHLISGAAGPTYSNSTSISLVIPGLRAPTDPTKDRTMIRCLHGQLPSGIRVKIGREAVYTPDVPVGGNTDVFAVFPPGDAIDRVFAEHNSPFFLDHDIITGQVGILKVQTYKPGADVAPLYDWKQDQGNSGVVIFQIDVPYTEGKISGVAAETALETAGSGPTTVYIRRADQDPTDPEPFRLVGCLAKEVEAAYNRELAQVMKGYGDNIASVSLMKNLTDFNCNSTGDTTYLEKILNAGIVEDTGVAAKITPKFGGALPEFEAILQTRTPKGFLILVRCPRCYVDRNGNVTYGGAEKQIPFKFVGQEANATFHFHNLYQSFFTAFGIQVTA